MIVSDGWSMVKEMVPRDNDTMSVGVPPVGVGRASSETVPVTDRRNVATDRDLEIVWDGTCMRVCDDVTPSDAVDDRDDLFGVSVVVGDQDSSPVREPDKVNERIDNDRKALALLLIDSSSLESVTE
jgi:hypothetical protein